MATDDANDRDPLWAELVELEQGARVRYEARFGSCPVCRLNATGVLTVLTITWALCDTCREAWPAGEHMFRGLDELSDREVRGHMRLLGRFRFSYRETLVKKSNISDQTPAPTASLEALEVAAVGAMAALAGINVADERVPVLVDEAESDVGALDRTARAVLCPPELTPVDDVVLRDFELAIAPLPLESSLIAELGSLHRDVRGTYPALAAVIRGPRGQRLIAARARERTIASLFTETLEQAQQTAVASALEKFARRVAEACHAAGELEPAAELVAVVIPPWRKVLRDLRTARSQYDEQRAAEERLLAEAAAQAEAATRLAAEEAQEIAEGRPRLDAEAYTEMQDRRRGLIDWYKRHAMYTFVVGGQLLSGEQAAGKLERGAEFRPFYIAQGTATFHASR